MNSEIYSASKAAVIQLSRYFAVHCGEMGIRVNTVSPGGISSTQGPHFTSSYENKVPMKRMASPSDITGAVAFFASDDSSYITGQNLVVDGGFTAW
jgi:NAD(P)-dependent dehydrogenase (short-subunit alcohol dehydrogenase family)